MLEWVSTHLAGCGLMGEQGAESIHAKFNSLKRTYTLESEILLLGLTALCKTITLAFRHTCQLQYQHLKKEERRVHNSLALFNVIVIVSTSRTYMYIIIL